MKTCLEVMDYHYRIYKVKMLAPPGTSNSGGFIPETNEFTLIKGHWEDVTYEMINRSPEGIYNVGDRMFYSGVDLSPRDKIFIEELNGGWTKWEVEGRNQKLPYWDKLKVRRYSYHLKQIQTDEEFTPEAVTSTPVSATPLANEEKPIDQLYSDPAPIPAPEPAPQPKPENIDPPEPDLPKDDGWTPSWMGDDQ